MPASKRLRRARRNEIAERIAKYVNETHDGNISAAARAIGCDYGTLYAAVNGHRARGPSLAFLMQLAQATGIPLTVWIGEG